MKIAKNVKIIICDDVRNELAGKISLMGIYSKDIFIQETPTVLPIIYFVIMLEDLQLSFRDIYLSLTLPAEPKPMTATYPAPSNLKIGSEVNLVIGYAPFKISGFGDCTFDVSFKKDEKPAISYSFAIKKSDIPKS